jgi:hypothetical protein
MRYTLSPARAAPPWMSVLREMSRVPEVMTGVLPLRVCATSRGYGIPVFPIAWTQSLPMHTVETTAFIPDIGDEQELVVAQRAYAMGRGSFLTMRPSRAAWAAASRRFVTCSLPRSRLT